MTQDDELFEEAFLDDDSYPSLIDDAEFDIPEDDEDSPVVLRKPNPRNHRHSRFQTRCAMTKARRRAMMKLKRMFRQNYEEWMGHRLQGFISDRTPCSCFMCRNQRRGNGWKNKPVQWKRVDDFEKADTEDVVIPNDME